MFNHQADHTTAIFYLPSVHVWHDPDLADGCTRHLAWLQSLWDNANHGPLTQQRVHLADGEVAVSRAFTGHLAYEHLDT